MANIRTDNNLARRVTLLRAVIVVVDVTSGACAPARPPAGAAEARMWPMKPVFQEEEEAAEEEMVTSRDHRSTKPAKCPF